VIQPFETITAENGNQTLCIYSTGNAISNQRKALMDSDNHSGHTEDGMVFGVTWEKWSDGSVRLKEVEILPTWVIRTPSGGGKYTYRIIPLDTAIADWKTFGLSDATLKEAKASYNRTLELVGAGINDARIKLSLAEMPLTVN
jgi:poly-gamma-glutamate synthesis protein (capsule biosynthesis protein)